MTHQREAVERVVARLNSFTTCGCSDDDWPQLRYDAVHLIDNLASEEPTEGDETGWLVEEDGGWGVTHWIALIDNIWERGWYISDRDQPSPVRRVKDSNEALRFARKQDAEAFISLFQRFLLCPVATEHEWPAMRSQQSGNSHEDR